MKKNLLQVFLATSEQIVYINLCILLRFCQHIVHSLGRIYGIMDISTEQI